ncbi:unnamed protein product [Prorocentrum cordatum]|uniref:ATP-dependent DNA helicase n=1 Tax=Prorocentrum cordatum TaxID=2364126 RepID=A0ABN9S7A8_9DINO|nr:unnamed protein product [Polarella glacialis]
MNVQGYPLYRRRAPSGTAVKNGHVIDARDVVPYSPVLSRKLGCHLNIEHCASLKSVKYFYKYIHKGHDRAVLSAQADEVQQYIDTRYVGPSESTWRLLSFPIQRKSHTAQHLAVHLPGLHRLHFHAGGEAQALSDGKHTTLTAWFELNSAPPPDGQAPAPQDLLYVDVPRYFTWDRGSAKWKRRSGKTPSTDVLGRLHTSTPAEGQRWHLHLLLLHVRGTASRDDLAPRIEGVPEDARAHDFRAACQARGLAETDDEYTTAMLPLFLRLGAQGLRNLFAVIPLHCNVGAPRDLYDKFAADLADDYTRDHDAATAANHALVHLQSLLAQAGTTLEHFNLPPPPVSLAPEKIQRGLLREQAHGRCACAQRASEARPQMNADQAAVFDAVAAALADGNGTCISQRLGSGFLDGPGGAGKTFAHQAVLDLARGKGDVALACAWSGIAALLLEGGRTCHSRFGLPAPLPAEDAQSNIAATSARAEALRRAAVIVQDEAPMAPREALQCVDDLRRDSMNSDAPFGGKILLMGGDFRQVLPAMPKASRDEIISHSLQYHHLWTSGYVQVHSLTVNMRARRDAAWQEFLLRVGDGTEPTCPHIGPQSLRLPDDIAMASDTPPTEARLSSPTSSPGVRAARALSQVAPLGPTSVIGPCSPPRTPPQTNSTTLC